MMRSQINKYYMLVIGDLVAAVSEAGNGSAEALIKRLFSYYCKRRDFVSLNYVVTDENLLSSVAHYHLGLVGGRANVFSFDKKILPALKEIPLKSYNMVAVSNDDLFPQALGHTQTLQSRIKDAYGVHISV